jgi:hypothetical protein
MNNRYEQVRASLPSESAGGEQRKTPRSNGSSAWRIGKADGVTAARFLSWEETARAPRVISRRGNRSGFFLGDETGSDFFPLLNNDRKLTRVRFLVWRRGGLSKTYFLNY